MWIEFENRWLNVDQVVSINEDAKTISLSNGKEVQISEGGISVITKHVKGLAIQQPKAKAKRGKYE
tara:strand:- start:1126 stop:1323 length:198 start_codon:yes stop_codon:yes gene_type:complete